MRWLSVILNIILFFFLTTYILTLIITLQIPMDMPRTNDTAIKLLSDENILRQVYTAIYGMVFITMFNIIKKIPLRLSKAMFVCAAGEREKMKYCVYTVSCKDYFWIYVYFYSNPCLYRKSLCE